MLIADELTEEAERLHEPADVPLWAENYMTVGYAPDAELGVYFHLCRTPAEMDLWEQEFALYLPGDRFLVAHNVGPATWSGDTLAAGNVTLGCEAPFERWTHSYKGGARLVSGDELRSGPLRDGGHVPVDFEMTFEAFGPPYVFDGMRQTWATGHYEQHLELTGILSYGSETVELQGTGMRDHSWGPRDYALLGDHVWLHGQFPESGRTFMVAHVVGVGGAEPFTYAVLGDRTQVEVARVTGAIPLARSVEEAEQAGYVLELETDTTKAVISAQIVTALRMAFEGPNGIRMGFHRGPGINHDYVEAQSRFEWGGEVGYGLTERTIQLYGSSATALMAAEA